MATVKLIDGMEKLDGWSQVSKLLESMMDENGLEDWNAIIGPSPPKEPCYRAEIRWPEKTFIMICPPISLADPKMEAKMQAHKILSEFLSLLKKKGKDSNSDSMKE